MFLLRFRKRTRMGDLAVGGLVTLEGEVQSENRLTIPASGTTCVYYSMLEEVYKKGERGRGRPLWFCEKRETKCFTFRFSDGTGTVEVREAADRIAVENGHEEAGNIRGKRNRRYGAAFIRSGDRVRIRGLVQLKEETKEGPLFILAAPPKKALPVLVMAPTPPKKA